MTTIDVKTETLLTDKEVAALLGGIGRSTVWLYVKKGTIPPPIKLGHLARFLLSDIEEVIEQAKCNRKLAKDT